MTRQTPSPGPPRRAVTPPLQVLLFRPGAADEVRPYEEAIVRAFQGGTDDGGWHLAAGEDLSVQLAVFGAAPASGLSPSQTLDSFCHTLTLVLAADTLVAKAEDALWSWIEACWAHASRSRGRHSMFAIVTDPRQRAAVTSKRPGLAALPVTTMDDLDRGSSSSRPVTLSVRAIHEARLLLASGLAAPRGPARARLRLLVGHARPDSLPLAPALVQQIAELDWLGPSYAAADVPIRHDWNAEIGRSVGSSLIVMLRTDGHDDRLWARHDVLWTDEYAVPAVLVDAHTGLAALSPSLTMEGMPVVIPDGNVVSMLFLALREDLRLLLIARRIEAMRDAGMVPPPAAVRVFSFAPGMSALLRACRSLALPADVPRMILYPDPPLPAGVYEAAHALVHAYAPPGTRLMTPETLAATPGGER